jgi:hypothetical protein
MDQQTQEGQARPGDQHTYITLIDAQREGEDNQDDHCHEDKRRSKTKEHLFLHLPRGLPKIFALCFTSNSQTGDRRQTTDVGRRTIKSR